MCLIHRGSLKYIIYVDIQFVHILLYMESLYKALQTPVSPNFYELTIEPNPLLYSNNHASALRCIMSLCKSLKAEPKVMRQHRNTVISITLV